MKNNKLIGLICVVFLLLVATATATVPFPKPIKGVVTINGFNLNGYYVTVENLETNEILTVNKVESLETDNGIFFFDMVYDFEIPVTSKFTRRGTTYSGDILKITACSFSSGCVKEIEVNDELGIYDYANLLIFNIRDDSVTTYQCFDGSHVIDASTCPVPPEVETETIEVPVETPGEVQYQCWNGEWKNSQADCSAPPEPGIEPEDDSSLAIGLSILSGLIGIALLILGKFKWGKGFVGLANYYKKKGDEAKKAGDLESAEKYYTRAAKMVSTAISKAKDGKYGE